MAVKCPIIRAKCPESTECPCWQELVFENAQTGETKLEKDCLFRVFPKIMIEVLRASNRPAASIDMLRDEVNTGVSKAIGAMLTASHRIAELDHRG